MYIAHALKSKMIYVVFGTSLDEATELRQHGFFNRYNVIESHGYLSTG
jgi:hypothetical protein